MNKDREVRTFAVEEMRVVRKEGDAPKIVGHAAVFDSPTMIGGLFGGFTEEVAPGAFKDSISEDDIRALFNHDPNIVLGRNKAGTLDLSEDEKGLRYEIRPPETQGAKDVMESIERGDITGSSFGFYVEKEEWEKTEKGEPDKRRLLKVKLFDVSPVTFPAYDDTDVAKRKHDEFRAQADAQDPEIEKRPYPNEHACRLRDPGDFKAGSFRRVSRESDGKEYDVIMGRLKGETAMTEQAYRYDKTTWGVDEARDHCEEHDGILFEPAEEEKKSQSQVKDNKGNRDKMDMRLRLTD